MFFLSSECFPSVQRLLSSVNRSSLFQHWLRFVSSLYPSVFPPSNTCCPPSNICSAPSKGLRSIKRASLHQKGSAPSKGLLSIKRAPLHQKGFSPFLGPSNWLRSIQLASLRFLCYPSGFRSFKSASLRS